MPSPNITNPLIGLQNWVASQVKEDPILEKRIRLPVGTGTMKDNFNMGSQLFKRFLQKKGIYLLKQGPPGLPPREGLQWKPSTRRWIRPKGAEFKAVKSEIKVIANNLPNIAKYGINFETWGTPAVEFVEHNLASIEKKIGYNSQEAHESGEGGQTPLEIMVDQVYGAIESQRAFGGLQGGTWEELIGEVNEHLSGIPETEQEKAQKLRDQKRKEEEATREPYDPSSPESLRRRAENRRSREALGAARTSTAQREQQRSGTDPSWYGR